MPDDLARLARIPTANAKQILRELGIARTAISRATRLTTDRRIAGRARTLRFLPAREDAKPPVAALNRATIETLEPGDALVIEATGIENGAVLGDMLAARAHARGAVAVITDGVVRDVEGIAEIGLPVWATGTFPDSTAGVAIPWDAGVAIRCGGALVVPGDYVLADRDGAIVVPPSRLGELLARAEALALEDEFSQSLLRSGEPLARAYPIPDDRRDDLARFLRERR